MGWSTEFSSAHVVWNNASLITINGVMLDLSENHLEKDGKEALQQLSKNDNLAKTKYSKGQKSRA